MCDMPRLTCHVIAEHVTTLARTQRLRPRRPLSPDCAALLSAPRTAAMAAPGAQGPPDIGGLISLKVDNFPFTMACAYPPPPNREIISLGSLFRAV